MPCYQPLKAYRSLEVNSETGRRGLVFKSTGSLVEGSLVTLPCGQCVGCRLDRAKQWAMRCMHEAKMHEQNVFLTLTYDDQHVPQDYSVKLRDYQLFVDRVRKRLGRFRYLGNGEYGDANWRPHYHFLCFGLEFSDKKRWTKRGEHQTYKSELLGELWPFGLHEIGDVTYKSAGYVARYCLKKVTGDRADDHYLRVSPVDGQAYRVAPEFATMSRRPGIGSSWFEKYSGDAFPSDFVIVEGRKVKPPAFYLNKLAAEAGPVPEPGAKSYFRELGEHGAEPIKRARKVFASQPAQRWNSSKERLKVREEVQQRRLERLQRQL